MELKNWSQFFIWFISICAGLGALWFISPEDWNYKNLSLLKIIIILIMIAIVAFIAFLLFNNFDVIRNFVKFHSNIENIK